MNQTRITATAPRPNGTGTARSTVIVDSEKFLAARPIEVEGLMGLLERALRARGGDLDRVTYEAEPVGPQIRLVAVDGARL